MDIHNPCVVYFLERVCHFFPLDFKIQRKISVSSDDNKCTRLLYIYRLMKNSYEYKRHFSLEEFIVFLLDPVKHTG